MSNKKRNKNRKRNTSRNVSQRKQQNVVASSVEPTVSLAEDNVTVSLVETESVVDVSQLDSVELVENVQKIESITVNVPEVLISDGKKYVLVEEDEVVEPVLPPQNEETSKENIVFSKTFVEPLQDDDILALGYPSSDDDESEFVTETIEQAEENLIDSISDESETVNPAHVDASDDIVEETYNSDDLRTFNPDEYEPTDAYVEEFDDGQINPHKKILNVNEFKEFKKTGLPPHMNLWDVKPSPYNEDFNIIVFYNNGKPVTHIELNPESVQELITTLNNEVAYVAESKIDGWYLRVPESKEYEPYLHFSSQGGIVESIELNETFMKEIMPQLLKIYDPNNPEKESKFKKWVMKHKIMSTLGVMFILFAFGSWIISSYT